MKKSLIVSSFVLLIVFIASYIFYPKNLEQCQSRGGNISYFDTVVAGPDDGPIPYEATRCKFLWSTFSDYQGYGGP